MSVFRSRGFDSLIGKDTKIKGDFLIAANSTLIIDGEVTASTILGLNLSDDKAASKTTLMVNGMLTILNREVGASNLLISVPNVIVAGQVTCGELRVEGTLAVKSGARLNAKMIFYRKLVIETGAVVHGQMCHLDHISQGEQGIGIPKGLNTL